MQVLDLIEKKESVFLSRFTKNFFVPFLPDFEKRRRPLSSVKRVPGIPGILEHSAKIKMNVSEGRRERVRRLIKKVAARMRPDDMMEVIHRAVRNEDAETVKYYFEDLFMETAARSDVATNSLTNQGPDV